MIRWCDDSIVYRFRYFDIKVQHHLFTQLYTEIEQYLTLIISKIIDESEIPCKVINIYGNVSWLNLLLSGLLGKMVGAIESEIEWRPSRWNCFSNCQWNCELSIELSCQWNLDRILFMELLVKLFIQSLQVLFIQTSPLFHRNYS